MKRIGLLGCGAMGTRIALAMDSGLVPARLTHIFDSSGAASRALAARLESKPEIVANSHLLSSNPVDMVGEAASQDAVRDAALGVLQNRRDLLVMSAGALLDPAVREVLEEACRDYGRSVYVPSGALAGIDAVRAARGGLGSVTITTTKHPRSLRGARFFEESGTDPGSISSPTTLFEGPAEEAVRLFPANVNVAATLSLAGIGGARTRVRVVADPGADANEHRIEASGGFGSLSATARNLPDPANPGTSALAALSAIEALRSYCSGGIRLGT